MLNRVSVCVVDFIGIIINFVKSIYCIVYNASTVLEGLPVFMRIEVCFINCWNTGFSNRIDLIKEIGYFRYHFKPACRLSFHSTFDVEFYLLIGDELIKHINSTVSEGNAIYSQCMTHKS